jgi:hypothetical protein
MDILIWIEQSAYGTWLRESASMWAFPLPLTLHAIGMGFLVGTNSALNFRILGFAESIPLRSMERVFPVMWFGLVVNALSGVALLTAYPIKAFTNPVFYIKLILIALALIVLVNLRKYVRGVGPSDVIPKRIKLLAGASLFLWALATTAGRLLAYTYNRLTSQDIFFF